MDRLQVELSDVVTFHNYDSPTELEKRINWLKRYRRPLICTEYMARGNGSFFMGGLMVGRVHNVGMVNWGLVQGKTQTHLPWDSWERPYTDREPSIWFHQVFRTDGTPYIPEEVEFIRRMTGSANTPNRQQCSTRTSPRRAAGRAQLSNAGHGFEGEVAGERYQSFPEGVVRKSADFWFGHSRSFEEASRGSINHWGPLSSILSGNKRLQLTPFHDVSYVR